MNRFLTVMLTVGVVLVWPTDGHAQDDEGLDPAEAVEIKRNNEDVWYLDFKQGKLQQLQMKDDTGHVEQYWFLPYEITNNDKVKHEFFLDITAFSDRSRHKHRPGQQEDLYYAKYSRSSFGESEENTASTKDERKRLRTHTHRYHDMWIPDVYQEVRKVLGVKEGEELLNLKDFTPDPNKNTPPRINDQETDQSATIDMPAIEPGQTMKCVAIFHDFDEQMDVLTVFVHGLTNSGLFNHEDDDHPIGANERTLTEAVLVLTYNRPGDEFGSDTDPISFRGRRWVDHKRTIKVDLEAPDPDSDPLAPKNQHKNLPN